MQGKLCMLKPHLNCLILRTSDFLPSTNEQMLFQANRQPSFEKSTFPNYGIRQFNQHPFLKYLAKKYNFIISISWAINKSQNQNKQ